MRKAILFFIPLVVASLAFIGCGGGGSSTTTGSASTIVSGTVVDGYVSGAKVSVYSDPYMTDPIGEGTTDFSGHFEITIPEGTLPGTVYMKSEGGWLTDTGFPAPTMRYAGSPDSYEFNITPVTDHLYSEMLKDGLNLQGAMTRVSSQLGIPLDTLYKDPEVDSAAHEAVRKVLSSGTQSSGLNPGVYDAYMIVLDRDMAGSEQISNISDFIATHRVAANLTVSDDGTVTGMTEDGRSVSGVVEGSSIALKVVDDSVIPQHVSHLAGEIGIMGSISGMVTEKTNTAGNVTDGYFIMTVHPNNLNDYQAIENQIADMMIGSHYFTAADTFRADGSYDPQIHWGKISISAMTSGIIGVSEFTLYHDSSPDTSQSMAQVQGTIDMDPHNHPTLIEGFQAFDPSSGHMEYILSTPGNRQGLFIVSDGSTGTILSIGKALMHREDSAAPTFNPDTGYHLEIARVHQGLIGETRSPGMIESEILSHQDINTPSWTAGGMGGMNMERMGHMGDTTSTTGMSVFSGSMMGWKVDTNSDGMGDANDMMVLASLYPSGAMSGEFMMGGTINGTALSTNFPGHYVAYAKPANESPPAFNGTLHFVERVTYSMGSSEYAGAYGFGSITIDDSTAPPTVTLVHTTPGGESVEYTLTLSVTDGMYHMEGPTPSGNYIDIFWPSGGKKAVWMESDDPTGSGTITAVGEAFMTY